MIFEENRYVKVEYGGEKYRVAFYRYAYRWHPISYTTYIRVMKMQRFKLLGFSVEFPVYRKEYAIEMSYNPKILLDRHGDSSFFNFTASEVKNYLDDALRFFKYEESLENKPHPIPVKSITL